ncbi:HIT family protein [Reichenbachiella sp.]|uniref:HIT family protein n=1 Tax=Reichenbachiella sp. TaxID=2184521 RepID=UPI003BAE82A0
MPSIFSKIISREIPAHIVAESESYLAFLDINPLMEGHCLAIPKVDIDYIYDLDDDMLAGLHVFAKKVALGIQKAIPCERIAVSVLGLEVPHAHVHLIPMNTMDDANFARPKLKPAQEELAETAAKIKSAIQL